MKKLLSLFALLCIALCSLTASAQRPSEQEREAWMKEMQQYKNEFISKKLELSEEQRAKFLPLYAKMDAEIRKSQKAVRNMCRKVEKDDKVEDVEFEKCAEALYELKGRENKIEMKYFKEFKAILSPKQLFKLKQAEMDFSRQLMKDRQMHHPDADRKARMKGNRR